MKKYFYPTLGVLFILAVVAGCIWWDFFVWRKIHPQAPLWTFLFAK